MKNEYSFRKVKDLRKTYSVFARFDAECKRRFFADIVRKQFLGETPPPDVYLVMINPGSCKIKMDSEKTAIEYPVSSAVEAVSDPAMKCVMWLMDTCELNKVRIINLLDIVEPKYDQIIKTLSDDQSRDQLLRTSIFSDDMQDEYKEIVSDDALFILAWGKDKRLNPLKEQALKRISSNRIINHTVDGISYDYIKPPKYSLQQDILRKLTEEYWEWKESNS